MHYNFRGSTAYTYTYFAIAGEKLLYFIEYWTTTHLFEELSTSQAHFIN